MFGGGGAPSVVRSQASPKESDKEVQDAAAEALRRKQRQKGYRSTILAKDMISSDTMKKLETLGS